jgi:hypothetical protein
MSREGAVEQTWESNRFVRIENVGETDVVNPWLSNGRNTLRTLDEILASVATPGMSDKEKACAIWFEEIRRRYHWSAGDNNELCDPVKVFNVYGYNTCGNDSICVAGLWKKAGLKAAPAHAIGHCISQAFYDGRWHFFDGDMHAMYLLRDNETVAGEQDLVRDHDLIKRTHTQGILLPDNRASEERAASLYVYEGAVTGDRNCDGRTTMNMTLRPGEALTWRWGHTTPVKSRGTNPLYPDTICNGLWEYRPDFTKELWTKGAATIENIKTTPEGLMAEDGKVGIVVWTIRTPYVLVGGKVDAEARGAELSFQPEGKMWTVVSQDSLDKYLRANANPLYEYKLRCVLRGAATLKRVAIINDLQMAPRALPEMVIGDNTFVYSDQSPGERNVRITHEWIERSDSKPPDAPAEALNPRDGGEINGTDIVFQWKPPADKASDYLFELSDRADMKWPLSMSFYKLISRTADKGKAQYALLYAGLLNPDKPYYWHVRAKNAMGAWGQWSKTWSFTARAPGYPLDLAVDYDANKNLGTLKWKPNPTGRKPAKFRVYGSDEKGFSVSDVPYKVNVGVSKELSPQFPANFIAETTATELAVLGPDASPAANKTHYRVVAVDEQGKNSGPSDFAIAPHPVIFSKPNLSTKAGAEYRYQAAINRSLGDLRMQGGEVPSFWNIEKPKFSLQKAPNWLKLDERTGLLTGKPDTAGKFEVTLTAELEREVRKLDENALKWGTEKVLSTSMEKVGSATQSFVIEVIP